MQPSDYSSQSAVDLGARKAALEREAKRQAEAASGRGNPYAVDVTEQNFQAEVIQRSTQVPVVLALLNTWSEQSKQVEGALDRIAAAAGGQWVLAKVDIEATPQLAQALGSPPAPTVAMVIQGQVVPGPSGPATQDQLRQWLSQIFDGLRQQGMLPEGYTGLGDDEAQDDDEPTEDPTLAEATRAARSGDFDAAEAAYDKAVKADPANVAAKVGLAQVRLLRRVRQLDVQAVRGTAAAEPDNVAAQCQVADIDMAGGKVEDAFDRLIGVVRRTRDDARNQAREHLLSLFELLPPGDQRVTSARRSLTSALF